MAELTQLVMTESLDSTGIQRRMGDIVRAGLPEFPNCFLEVSVNEEGWLSMWYGSNTPRTTINELCDWYNSGEKDNMAFYLNFQLKDLKKDTYTALRGDISFRFKSQKMYESAKVKFLQIIEEIASDLGLVNISVFVPREEATLFSANGYILGSTRGKWHGSRSQGCSLYNKSLVGGTN